MLVFEAERGLSHRRSFPLSGTHSLSFHKRIEAKIPRASIHGAESGRAGIRRVVGNDSPLFERFVRVRERSPILSRSDYQVVSRGRLSTGYGEVGKNVKFDFLKMGGGFFHERWTKTLVN